MRYAVFCGLFVLGCLLGTETSAREYNVLVIRVDFPYEEPDHDTTSGRGEFDLSDYYSDPVVRSRYFNPWDVPPHDKRYFDNHMRALDRYWRTVSEDRVTLRWNILPEDSRGAYRMSNIFYKYGNGRTKEQTYRKLAELFREAVETCKRTEGSRIDFSQYDTFMIIHAGVGQETSGGLNDIPSAYLNPSDFDNYLGGPINIDGTVISTGLILPEMASENGLGGLNGIMAQMFGHHVGLPSLSNNEDGLPAAGGWSLMDTGGMAFGYTSRGFIPTHPDIWSKVELGWIEPVVVTRDTTLDIAATHVNIGLPRAVKIPITADEYLLIENRERYASRDSLPKVTFSDSDTSGVWMSVDHYDAFIPGSGILIWRVNDRIITRNRNDDAINNDRYRRGVDLLEADGREDIGASFGFGDPRSEYSEGHDDDTFKKGGRDTLSPSSDPNSGSMWGARSGVTVKVNSESGDIMNVTITFAEKSQHIGTISFASRLTAADLNGDGSDEIIASGENTVTVWDARNNRAFFTNGRFHPSVVPGLHGGRSVLAVPDSTAIRFLAFGNSGFELLAELVLPKRDGVSPIVASEAVFSQTSTGGHVIVPVVYDPNPAQPGDHTAALLDISPERFPDLSANQIWTGNDVFLSHLAVSGDNIAFTGENGFLYAGSISTGKLSSILLPDGLNTGARHGIIMADLDRDNNHDIIVQANDRLIFVKADLQTDSPGMTIAASVSLEGFRPGSEPVAADIDSDGYPEVLAQTPGYLYAFRANGVPANGFPWSLPPGDSHERIVSSPVVCDFDGNGSPDIAFFTSDGRMISRDALGNTTPGYPIALTCNAFSASPLVYTRPDTGKASVVTGAPTITIRDIPGTAPVASRLWPMWRGGPGLTSSLPNSQITNPVQITASFEAFCYPNPITGSIGTFRIVPEGRTDCRITVFSADGKKVFEHYLPEGQVIPGMPNEVRMDASALASGLYIARIQTRNRSENYKLGVLK